MPSGRRAGRGGCHEQTWRHEPPFHYHEGVVLGMVRAHETVRAEVHGVHNRQAGKARDMLGSVCGRSRDNADCQYGVWLGENEHTTIMDVA